MQLFLSSSFSRGLSSIFYFVLLLSFILEGCNPRNPPLDPPMQYDWDSLRFGVKAHWCVNMHEELNA